jgi:uncharacterized protein GlcG (DUF336 family)
LAYVEAVVQTQGGLPLGAGGCFLGGIGVSAVDSATDEECAEVATNAVADDLKFTE